MCQRGKGEFRSFSFCFKPIVGEVPQHGQRHCRRCHGVICKWAAKKNGEFPNGIT